MRNQTGLTKEQIEHCELIWEFLCEESDPPEPFGFLINLSFIIHSKYPKFYNIFDLFLKKYAKFIFSKIWRCKIFSVIKINKLKVKMIISEASGHSSKTRFNENRKVVILGADAYPGYGTDANSRMSVLACLAHELGHLERFQLGYQRPSNLPDMLIDEAETSLHASFIPVLSKRDRIDLIEDARDRINSWIIDQSQR